MGVRQCDHDINDIVEEDLKEIMSCDVLLANCFRPSAGTSCEVVYAYKYGLYIVNVGSDSPWIKYHADASFATLEEAIIHLIKNVDVI